MSRLQHQTHQLPTGHPPKPCIDVPSSISRCQARGRNCHTIGASDPWIKISPILFSIIYKLTVTARCAGTPCELEGWIDGGQRKGDLDIVPVVTIEALLRRLWADRIR